jgi:hypothetical protein
MLSGVAIACLPLVAESRFTVDEGAARGPGDTEPVGAARALRVAQQQPHESQWERSHLVTLRSAGEGVADESQEVCDV